MLCSLRALNPNPMHESCDSTTQRSMALERKQATNRNREHDETHELDRLAAPGVNEEEGDPVS